MPQNTHSTYRMYNISGKAARKQKILLAKVLFLHFMSFCISSSSGITFQKAINQTVIKIIVSSTFKCRFSTYFITNTLNITFGLPLGLAQTTTHCLLSYDPSRDRNAQLTLLAAPDARSA